MLDHIGGPLGIGPYAGKQAELFPQWKADVKELAQCPNVVAKLGGLAMEINGWGWNGRDLPANSDEIVAVHRGYYLHAIDCFGPDRCMFESNFPVDKVSASYGVLWNSFKRITKSYSAGEKPPSFMTMRQGFIPCLSLKFESRFDYKPKPKPEFHLERARKFHLPTSADPPTRHGPVHRHQRFCLWLAPWLIETPAEPAHPTLETA